MALKFKVRQSAVNAWTNTDDFCQYAWYLKYIKRIETEPSEAMQKGLRFEYECIGDTAGGEVPEELTTKAGKPTADQLRITEQADEFKRIIAESGIKILDTQISLETETDTGIIDFLAEKDGKKFLVDLKLSGARADDRWSDYQWAMPEERADIRFQAIHYQYLYKQKYGEWIPFYVWVFGLSGWVKFLHYQITLEEAIPEYQNYKRMFLSQINEAAVKGFPANPEYNKCKSCAFRDICESKATLPKTIVV